MLKSRNGNIRPSEKFVLVSCFTTTSTSTTKGQTITINASPSDVDNNNEPPPFTMLNHKLLPLPYLSAHLPHQHLGAFFTVHYQYPAIGAELPSLLLLPATPPQPSLLQVRLYLSARSSSLIFVLYPAAHCHWKPAGAYWTWKSVDQTSRRCESLQSSPDNTDLLLLEMILTARYIDTQIIHGHSGTFYCLVCKLSLLSTASIFLIFFSYTTAPWNGDLWWTNNWM